MSAPRTRRALVFVTGALAIAGCSEPAQSPLAERGRQVYLAQCSTCHAANPRQAGPVGPAVGGSSRELLEAKVLRGTYPAGYAPKRSTTAMPPMPQLSAELDALAAYLESLGTAEDPTPRATAGPRRGRAAVVGSRTGATGR